MDKATWLTYAFAMIWLLLGAYLTSLLFRLKRLEKRVQQIEILDEK